jgi:hypothetical protein
MCNPVSDLQGLPGDPQDDEGDRETDQRISDLRSERHKARAHHNS